jgi:hypothetical protein
MLVVSMGYILLLANKILTLKKGASKKTDDQSYAEDRLSNMYGHGDTMKLFGYALLFTFFGVIHFFPQFTFHLRFYDIFAAVGYFIAMFTKYVPLWVAYVPLVVYYVLGGGIKIFEKGPIEKIQLVARILLAVYYGIGMFTIPQ